MNGLCKEHSKTILFCGIFFFFCVCVCVCGVCALQYRFREQVWPDGRGWDWGDREERKAVRDYLKKVWWDNVHPTTVEATLDTVRNEKNYILNVSYDASQSCISILSFPLQWWWRDRYEQSGTADTTSEYFGQWLLSQYQDYIKTHHPTNRQIGRN